MKAQKLYDMVGDIFYGNDVHKFFEDELGNPSPSGYTEVDDNAVSKFVEKIERETMIHSPSFWLENYKKFASLKKNNYNCNNVYHNMPVPFSRLSKKEQVKVKSIFGKEAIEVFEEPSQGATKAILYMLIARGDVFVVTQNAAHSWIALLAENNAKVVLI